MMQATSGNPDPAIAFPNPYLNAEPECSVPRPRWEDSRLCRHADYQLVYAVSRKQFSTSMVWFACLRQESESRPGFASRSAPARVGLTVGKVLGKAHDRNRIKRRLRAAIRAHVALLPTGLDLILHPRRTVLDAEFSSILAEVESIFSRAAESARRNPGGLLKKAPEPAAEVAARAQGGAKRAPRSGATAVRFVGTGQ